MLLLLLLLLLSYFFNAAADRGAAMSDVDLIDLRCARKAHSSPFGWQSTPCTRHEQRAVGRSEELIIRKYMYKHAQCDCFVSAINNLIKIV